MVKQKKMFVPTEEQIKRKEEFLKFEADRKKRPIYQEKEWKKWRKEILGDNPKCLMCEKTSFLSIHHLYKVKKEDSYLGSPREDVVILCRGCHWALHQNNLRYCSICGKYFKSGFGNFFTPGVCYRHPESPEYEKMKGYLELVTSGMDPRKAGIIHGIRLHNEWIEENEFDE